MRHQQTTPAMIAEAGESSSTVMRRAPGPEGGAAAAPQTTLWSAFLGQGALALGTQASRLLLGSVACGNRQARGLRSQRFSIAGVTRDTASGWEDARAVSDSGRSP